MIDLEKDTHSKGLGYLLWIFGFMGAHRFYFGLPVTGTLWFLTFGMFGVGWLIDIFLIPSMDREADQKYTHGAYNYNVAWLLLTFLGIFGAHRFYLKKWISAVLYLCTGAYLTFGLLYDFWKLNQIVSEANQKEK